jgi:hypothetical protein
LSIVCETVQDLTQQWAQFLRWQRDYYPTDALLDAGLNFILRFLVRSVSAPFRSSYDIDNKAGAALIIAGQTTMQVVVQGRDSLVVCRDTTAMEGYFANGKYLVTMTNTFSDWLANWQRDATITALDRHTGKPLQTTNVIEMRMGVTYHR